MTKTTLFLVLVSFAACFNAVSGHGRLLKPPSRSSVWRVPKYQAKNPPINYNDNQLYCGGIHQADNPGTNCGICGDPLSSPRPRENEFGGVYYKGIITGKYSPGQVMDVEVQITAAHLGFMEFRLCNNLFYENQDCFNQNLLARADGNGSRVPVTFPGTYKTRLRLPLGVRCDHCVLQWNYRAGNNWGQCSDGTFGVDCGPQETFRGCADISIQ